MSDQAANVQVELSPPPNPERVGQPRENPEDTEEDQFPALPPIDLSWLQAEHNWDSFTAVAQYPLSSKPKDVEPWKHCSSVIADYDKEMCDEWKEEINMFLLFASLFSAVVTAFQVEGSKGLREDAEATTALLSQILHQLARDPVEGPLPFTPRTPYAPSRQAAEVYILWSMSLTVSLFAVALGLLCLQWIREYRRTQPGLSPQQLLSMRQMKYQGLLYWRMPWIVASLPVLFLISLLLFLAGLLESVWLIGVLRVTIPLTAVVALVGIILVGTAALPGIMDIASSRFGFGGSKQGLRPTPYCFYRSPQSAGLERVLTWVVTGLYDLFGRARKSEASSTFFNLRALQRTSSRAERERWYFDYVNGPQTDGASALVWFSQTFGYSQENALLLYKCVHDSHDEHFTWDVAWALAKADEVWIPPPRDRGSSRGIQSMVRDIALLRMLQYLFGDSGNELNRSGRKAYAPVPAAVHIHWLEVFIRVRWGLLPGKRGRGKEVWPYSRTLDRIEMVCPPISNHVNPRRESLPVISDSLRIQLLKHFMHSLEGATIEFQDCLELLSLLATVILNPLTPVDVDPQEQNIRFLDAGFDILIVYMQREAKRYSRSVESEAEVLFSWFCSRCLIPWTTRLNREAYLKNMHLLGESKVFGIFMGVVSKGSKEVVQGLDADSDLLVAWNRFMKIRLLRHGANQS